MRRWLAAGVLAALATATPASAPALPAGDAATGNRLPCDIHDVYYDVTGLKLHEQLNATWTHEDVEGGTATATTTQTGTLDWHQAHSTKAQRAKYRQIATFSELTGSGCRVGNMRQGDIHAKAQDMAYTISGTWAQGGVSTTCTGTPATTTRALSGHFDRLTKATSPPSRSIEIKLDLGPPRLLDCPLGTTHLRGARITYPPYTVTIPKTRILAHRTVTVPFRLTRAASTSWGDGKLTVTPTITGTLTLRKYKDCHVRTMDDLLHGHCYDP
jgi:hypothetical protein